MRSDNLKGVISATQLRVKEIKIQLMDDSQKVGERPKHPNGFVSRERGAYDCDKPSHAHKEHQHGLGQDISQ